MKTGTSIWLVVLVTSFNVQNYVCGQPSTQPYVFEHFDTSDGLLSNFANSVIQDSLGFIWFLNDNGLTRFDGYNFKPYPGDSVDQLRLSSNTREGMMLLDPAGDVWIVNQQSREADKSLTISRYDRRSDSFRRFYPNVGNSVITCAAFDKKKSYVYMGAFSQGLYSYDPKTNETEHFSNTSANAGKGSNTLFSIVDRDSTLLLATFQGLWVFNKLTKKIVRPPCNADDAAIRFKSFQSIQFRHPGVRVERYANDPIVPRSNPQRISAYE